MSCDDASTPTGRAGPSGSSAIVMTPQGPMLRFENAVVEEVVTRVKRTTTSFAPIPLPRIPDPEHIPLPAHLSSEGYPLAHEPTPDDMRFFTFDMDGKRVFVQEEGFDVSMGIPGQTCGPGWTRELPIIGEGTQPMTIDDVLLSAKGRDKGKGKARDDDDRSSNSGASNGSAGTRKRPHGSGAYLPMTDDPMVSRTRSPPRKKIRALDMGHEDDMSELASACSRSPSFSGDTQIVGSQHPSMGAGLEAVTLMSLAAMVEQFEKLPDKVQQHALMHMLRRARMPTIQRITAFAATALRRDFVSLLPHEVALQILTKCDLKSLAAGMRVNKRWNRMINSERSVWKARLVESGFTIGHGAEEEEEKSIKSRWEILDWQQRRQARRKTNRAGTPVEDHSVSIEQDAGPVPVQNPEDRPTAVKHIFRRRYTSNRNWLERKPKHTTFPGHGLSVVTCLQFDEDKIVSASDDHSINIYNTKTGQLRKRLGGHEGGVWALEYRGDTLVSGSTDRTIRIWDLETLKATHVFYGHTSTVRCLQIVDPVFDPATGEYQPAYPLFVSGSRDASIRVWRMPKKGETNIIPGNESTPPPPESNPYHIHDLEGHSDAVRALAVHGRICVSGSYDKTVRVWDIVKGTCIHVLHGHEHKVYSIAFDPVRNRCASGAMDNTVRVWDIETGTCLHTLSGHTSLVGLLGASPNYIVSAAADASVRVWDAETCELKHALTGHTAAITCFQHDENKVVSGSDGTLKLWDIRTGMPVRDLIIGISNVWQVAFKDHLLVAASNRNGSTVFDVFDFGAQPDPHGVDNYRLDSFRRKPWERHNPHEPQTYQSDDIDIEDPRDLSPTDAAESRSARNRRGRAGVSDRESDRESEYREREDREDREDRDREDLDDGERRRALRRLPRPVSKAGGKALAWMKQERDGARFSDRVLPSASAGSSRRRAGDTSTSGSGSGSGSTATSAATATVTADTSDRETSSLIGPDDSMDIEE